MVRSHHMPSFAGWRVPAMRHQSAAPYRPRVPSERRMRWAPRERNALRP
jgi:hypothetical protein